MHCCSLLLGPFGKRRVVYCDHVASGRAVSFIEDFICQQVRLREMVALSTGSIGISMSVLV